MIRKIDNDITPVLPLLYSILQLIENDEENYKKGCHWKYVKSNVRQSSISDSEKGYSSIISGEGKYCLRMKKGDSLASRFLVSIRHAYAHNIVKYDDSHEIIGVEPDGKHVKYLEGEICKDALEEIVKLIKESRDSKDEKTTK